MMNFSWGQISKAFLDILPNHVFKSCSWKVEDALKIDEIAFNKALEEEESKIKQEERFDKTWEKALEKIRKRGEKLFKEKE